MVVGVLAAQDGSPRRAAQGVGYEGVLEGGALGRQLADVRVAFGTLFQEPCVEVVCEDEDHVRTIRGLEDAGGRTTAGGEQASEQAIRHQPKEQKACSAACPRRVPGWASHEVAIVLHSRLSLGWVPNLGTTKQYGQRLQRCRCFTWGLRVERIGGPNEDA